MKRWWLRRSLQCSSAGLAPSHPCAFRTASNACLQCSEMSSQPCRWASAILQTTGRFQSHALFRGACFNACASPPTNLLVQYRQCATQTTESATPDTDAAEIAYQELFFAQPITHRLAAVTVAKYELAAQQQLASSTAAIKNGTAAAAAEEPFMPMFHFVRAVPPLVRDALFRDQQDVVQWVAASPLLVLVDHEGRKIDLAHLPTAAADAAEPGSGSGTPRYNPLLHVRVSVRPEWVQRVSKSEPLTKRDTASPHEASDAALTSSRGVQGEVIKTAAREALWREVHQLDEGMQRGVTNGAADTTAGLRRYVPLADVLHRIRNAAFLTPANEMPASTREALESLSMQTLEQVVEASGVRVGIGRRHSPGDQQQQYPALSEKFLWVVRSSNLPGKQRAAVFVALRRPDDAEPPRFRFVHPRINTATLATNYGGWGGESAVPTKEDVYEILKYIPVNWANMSILTIPAAVRKKHIRASSPQQWYRRQPYYFELRNVCGTVEIRRSIVLHPEAHGLTKEEAWEVLEMQLATGTANNLVQLNSDGAPAMNGDSQLEKNAVRFLLRVCPTYFAPMFLVAQRYTKKNLSEATMLAIARRRPQDFEELTTRFSDVVLVRRRGGADSSRWRAAFVADLEKYPEDVRGIMLLCNRMCPSWDRPEFIYVRLSESEQEAIGGYAGMMRVLQRHPTIFRVGKHFVCRADPSDPLTLQEVEPAHDDVTARSLLREENPYNSYMEIALVFHYVAPDSEPCTAAYLADCASPAIRCVLPTRIVAVVQQFPKLFACTETSPGVFAIRKLKPRPMRALPRPGGAATSVDATRSTSDTSSGSSSGGGGEVSKDGSSAAANVDNGAASAEENEADLIQMLEEEIAAEEEHLSREEVIQAVRTLVPESGVEAQQLLLWASMNVQRAANEYFGGVLKLAEALPQYFRVVTTEDSKMIYKV